MKPAGQLGPRPDHYLARPEVGRAFASRIQANTRAHKKVIPNGREGQQLDWKINLSELALMDALASRTWIQPSGQECKCKSVHRLASYKVGPANSLFR